MTSHRSETQRRNPLPQRATLGFSAWQLAVRYMTVHYSPDVLLKLQVYPSGIGSIFWGASISWGDFNEFVRDMESLGCALTTLWHKVTHLHPSLVKSDSELNPPIGYSETQWLDAKTQSLVERIVNMTQDTFTGDWLLIIIYQPSRVPNMRVQMRLLANSNQIRVGGRGDNMINAGHNLFDNAIQYFVSD